MVNDQTPRTQSRERVWDYPRPPRLESTARHIRIQYLGWVLADTRSAFRVLETSHPPTYYLPPQDVEMKHLVDVPGSSFCEWKGRATYCSVVVGGEERLERVAWSYPDPTPAFHPIRGYLAFYPDPLECFVDGERVEPQPGGFYGGWITSDLVGPFKGGHGTQGW